MRVIKSLLLFIHVLVFSGQAFSFVPVLEIEEGDGTRPLFSRQLSDAATEETRRIYDEIFMQYGCPMLLHSYSLLPAAEQSHVVKTLSQEFGAQEIIQEKVAARFGGKYKVRFVPDTVFQMATLVQVSELIIRWYKGDERAENLIRGLERASNPSVLESLLLSNIPAEEVRPEEQTAVLANFMKNTYGEINLLPSVRTLYFYVCNLLSEKFGGELNELEVIKGQYSSLRRQEDSLPQQFNVLHQTEHNLIRRMTKGLMEDYSATADMFDFALYKLARETGDSCLFEWVDSDNCGLPWPYLDIRRTTANLFLNPYHLPTLTEAAIAEYEAARRGNILLWRGENGVPVSIQGTVLENEHASQESSSALPCYVLGGVSNTLGQYRNEQGEMGPTLRIVTGLVSFASGVADRPHSVSYANTLLAGTFREGNTRRGGARTLDYYYSPRINGIACLEIPIKYFLKFPNGAPFRVSTLNIVGQLITKGELWHSRTLVNYTPDRIKGLLGGNEGRRLIEEDERLKLGYLCFQGLESAADARSWAVLSFLSDVMPGLDAPDKAAENGGYTPAVTPRDLPEIQAQIDGLSISASEEDWCSYLNLAASVSRSSFVSNGAAAAAAAVDTPTTSFEKNRPVRTDFFLSFKNQKKIHDVVRRAKAISLYGEAYAEVMAELSLKFRGEE